MVFGHHDDASTGWSLRYFYEHRVLLRLVGARAAPGYCRKSQGLPAQGRPEEGSHEGCPYEFAMRCLGPAARQMKLLVAIVPVTPVMSRSRSWASTNVPR